MGAQKPGKIAAAHALTRETNALINTPGDLIRATTWLITRLWALIAPPRWPITAISWLLKFALRTDDRSIESI